MNFKFSKYVSSKPHKEPPLQGFKL